MRNIPSETALLHEFLEYRALHTPDKIAVVYGDIRATYSELNSQSNRLADFLINLGVAKGERVVILSENGFNFITAYFGILKAGLVAVPISTGLKPDGLNHLLGRLEPKALIVSKRFERLIRAVDNYPDSLEQILIKSGTAAGAFSKQIKISELDEVTNSCNKENPSLDIKNNAVANIIYTSGSTGDSKGVMLTHANLVANTTSICEYLKLSSVDVQMVVLPFFYVMGLSLLNTHIAAGGRLVINNQFAFSAGVLEQMAVEKVTGFSGVPSTYAYLLHKSPIAQYRDRLPYLRYVSQAGGHLSRILKEKLRSILPAHTSIYIMYGATEAAARLTYVPPEMFDRKMNSIGIPIPGVKIRVLNKHGEYVPLGESGELVAYGPNIMTGYFKDPESTARALKDCGYYTGDIGYCDKSGYFFVTSRKDDILKVGGHRINPMEIDDTLFLSGLVAETVTFGMPDEILGQKLCALVTPLNGELDSNDLMALCSTRLPRYKLPKEIILVKNIPKKPNGKIDKGQCVVIAMEYLNAAKISAGE
jgi:acyl-CoA synthetase (AMP-forming)/AMP-acid ligase II